MATLQTQQITPAGTVPSYASAAGGGDEFAPDERTFLHVKNADSGAHTVTVVTPGTVYGLAIADLAVVVAPGTNVLIGPFDPGAYRGSDGLANITYSAVTAVSIAALRV